MPFGLITRAQLDARLEELRREYQAAAEDQRALVKRIQLEWEEMFDRFRRLLMRLNKRARDGSGEDAAAPQGHDDSGGTPGAVQPGGTHTLDPTKVAAWRARRGF